MMFSHRFAHLVLLLLPTVSAFAPNVLQVGRTGTTTARLVASTSVEERTVSVPLSLDEMIRQAVSAMKDAANAGTKRQIVRILLPRDAANADFGKFMESESSEAGNVNDVVLVPPDESWQGGIMQLYRSAAPTAQDMVQRLSVSEAGLTVERVTEDRSVDESGVDGVGWLHTSQVSCYVQPTQELVNDVILQESELANNDKKNLTTILLNPQWRQVDDALDTASAGTGFLSGLANFLGGKGGTLQRLKESGFTPVYSLEGYVCRGSNVRLLQVLDSQWNVFCERDDLESYVRVGSSSQRPTYQEVEAMLQDSDIGYKYARDIGMEPKL